MKYKLLLSITFVVAISLMGCSATAPAIAPQEEIRSDENKEANETHPPEQESVKDNEGVFIGNYENTVEDDEGNICLMYNTPIEEGIKTTVFHVEEGETNVSFENEDDGSTFFNIIFIDKSRSSSDPEKEINGCMNKLGEFDVKTTVVGLDGKEEQSYEKNIRIANKLEDIKTDFGDFSYYRVYYAIEPKDINKNKFTENAIFSNEDSIIVVKKLTGTSSRIKSKSAKTSIPELVKVLFNDVSYKDKLVADHTYNPEVILAEIDGLEDIPESVEVASSEEVIDDVKEDVKTEDKHDISEVEKPESKEKTETKTDNVTQEVPKAPLSGSFYYTCVDPEGVSWSISANSSTPVSGTTINWSGVYPGCYNAIAPLNANGSINYGAQVKNVMSFTLSGAYAQNGVIMWINAWESDGDGGMDAAVKWFPDGHYEG